MIKYLTTPLSIEDIKGLKIGDTVYISGNIVTARDLAHKYMVEHKPDFLKPILKDSIIYHCGPIVKKVNNEYTIVAAGPTTSIREEPYEYQVIKNYNVRGIIGKGGMKDKTLAACKEFGAVYFAATGGIAALLSQAIIKVKDVFMLQEFGVPEAFWVLEVKDFPVIVGMDSYGNSIYSNVFNESYLQFQRLVNA